jgi:hypothetical protein
LKKIISDKNIQTIEPPECIEIKEKTFSAFNQTTSNQDYFYEQYMMNKSNLFDLTEREEFMNLSFLNDKMDLCKDSIDDFKLEESIGGVDLDAPICKIPLKKSRKPDNKNISPSMKRISPRRNIKK